MNEKAKETKAAADAAGEEAAASPQGAENSPQSAAPESLYSVDELAKAAGLFGTTADIVRTALRMEGVTEAAVSDAKRIVEKFRKREVE